MDKKTIIAVVIALAVLFAYPHYMKVVNPPDEVEEGAGPELTASKEERAKGGVEKIATGAAPSADLEGAGTEKAAAERELKDEKLVTVETPLYRAVFSSHGGGVKRFELKHHRLTLEEGSSAIDMASPVGGVNPLETALKIEGLPTAPDFTPSEPAVDLKEGETKELLFKWTSPDGITVLKRYSLSAGSYTIISELEIANGSKRQLTGSASTLLTAIYSEEYPRYHSGPVLYIKDKAKRADADDDPLEGQGRVKWLGLEDKFFLLALVPQSDLMVKWHSAYRTESTASADLSFAVDLKPGYKTRFAYDSFIGPKEYSILRKSTNDLEYAIEFGFFSFMAKPTLVVLNFFNKYLKNYGIAIILLTVVIKILFFPLTKKSFSAMKDMQKLQPQMQALKKKYKDDKQTQNKEIMELYKRHKVSPLGGCLPMVLQIPVFIALYEVLSVAIELRHAPFALWLVDLSVKDPYYVTPLLMGATMFLQQKMTPSAMDPMQQKMMLMMPVIFTFLFLSFPSGLVLYWLVNNVLTIGQQWQIYRSK